MGIALKLLSATFGLLLFAACTAGCPLATPARSNVSVEMSMGGKCLAISGGGIRSGAVGPGVLQEISEQRLLSQYDYISDVSGGGYPLAGLVSQMLSVGSQRLHSNRELETTLAIGRNL